MSHCGNCGAPVPPRISIGVDQADYETVHTALGALVVRLWLSGDRSDALMRAALCLDAYTRGRCVDYMPITPEQEAAAKSWREAKHLEIESIHKLHGQHSSREALDAARDAIDAAGKWLSKRTQ